MPANWFGNIHTGDFKSYTLKDLRLEKGFKTSKDFAEHAGLSCGSYAAIELGYYKATASKQILIAKALDMTVEEVFPKQRESKVKLTVIHESPNNIEAMLQKQYGDKLQPRQA